MKPFAFTKIHFIFTLVVSLLSFLAFRLVVFKGQQSRILEVDNQDYTSAPLVVYFNGANPGMHTFTRKNDSFTIPGSVGFVELCKPINGILHRVSFLTSGDRMTVTLPISLSTDQIAHVETFGEFAGFAFPRRKDTYVFTPKASPSTISKGG